METTTTPGLPLTGACRRCILGPSAKSVRSGTYLPNAEVKPIFVAKRSSGRQSEPLRHSATLSPEVAHVSQALPRRAIRSHRV